MSDEHRQVIEQAWENRDSLDTGDVDLREAVESAITSLDEGSARVAESDGNGGWQVNQWLKKAVLLSFRLSDNRVMDGAVGSPAFDKVPSKFAGWGEARFREAGFRVVPGAIARRGSFIGKNCVLMPSFTNIGAYVGENTMLDTWASVGSCAAPSQVAEKAVVQRSDPSNPLSNGANRHPGAPRRIRFFPTRRITRSSRPSLSISSG